MWAEFKGFAAALRHRWWALMSGGFSIPFSAAAVYLDNRYAQVIFAALAFCAVWFAAFQIWKVERAGRLKAEHGRFKQKQLDEISDLRRQLVKLRIKMEKADAGETAKQVWAERFQILETKIAEKIEQFASRAEADIYRHRGNISRHAGGPRHQRFIDICIHDLDHLKRFIEDYSRRTEKA